MKVTALKKYKGSTYEVEFDDERKLYLHIDIVSDYGLSVGAEVERQELRKIIWASNFRRAYQYSLYCLDNRDYSAEEMYQKLFKTYQNEQLCLAVIEKLAKLGMIDDARYAERLARRLVEVKKYGFYRAKREITLKGIDDETAEEALEPYEATYEENLAELLRTKHARNLTDKSDRKSIEKVKNALARYGYVFSEINEAISEYFEGEEQSEE